MTEIFKFENQQVRFVGTAEDPWWVAADICAVLEIKNNRDALSRLDSDEKDVVITDTPGGNQEMVCINESGLYSLILTSRKPQAKKFKKWVTSEVLPAIRKTGSYSIPNTQNPTSPILTLEQTLALADYAAQTTQSTGISPAIAQQIKLETIIQTIPQSKPLLLPHKNAIANHHPLPETPLTPTEIGQKLAAQLHQDKISAKKINSKLLALGYQTSITRTKRTTRTETHSHYQATEKGQPHSTLLLSAYLDGHSKNTKPQLKWFPTIIPILISNWEPPSETKPQTPKPPKGNKLSDLQKNNKARQALLANPTDKEGKPLSIRAIARQCDLSPKLITKVKKELETSSSDTSESKKS